MSIENPEMHDLETAYYTGLGNIQGGDPEVLEDLGIPVSQETFVSHVASATEAAALAPKPVELSPADVARAKDHERDKIVIGLTQGDEDPIHQSPEERERNNAHIVSLQEAQAANDLQALLDRGESLPTARSVMMGRRARASRQN